MTTLEKVLYMADYIEPARDFDGVDELRRLAYIDLDAAMVLGLQMSLEDLRAGGITPAREHGAGIKLVSRQGKRI